MNRLHAEWHRLYLPDAFGPGHDATSLDHAPLVDAQARVRALVLELLRPSGWDGLGPVWRGVQADLGLPAPGIAVSGTEGFQLWFSLAEPLPVAQAWAFLALLQARYLADVAPRHVRLLPQADAALPPHAQHARLVPAPQAGSDHWSAFVAPDLAPVFADSPWLDIPPSMDGQADLLARLARIEPEAFDAALALLQPAVPGTPAAAPEAVAAATGSTHATRSASTAWLDPKRFLQDVMNDVAVPLALRIDAAKALLLDADASKKWSSDGDAR